MRKKFIHFFMVWGLVMILFTLGGTSDSQAVLSTQKADSKDSKLAIKLFTYPKFSANYYVVSKANFGVIIDAGGRWKDIINYINNQKIKVKFIILTHGHFDHIVDVIRLKKALKAKILIHKNDAGLFKETLGVDADIYVNREITLQVGRMTFQVLNTPGHTKGSISIKIDKNVFTGDTLFKESIGRTDLEGGNHQQIISSIKSKLMILDDNTRVFPGHGEETTIGSEKEHNIFLVE